MKKTLIYCLTAAMLLLALAGCGAQKPQEEAQTDRLTIVTTIYPQYDFANQIAGELAEVTMLLKPGAETHSYEPTPQDIKKLQSCDLFIYTGGENDVWVEGILDSMGEQRPDTLRLMDCVTTVEEEFVEGMEHDHDHDHEEAQDEAHVHQVDEHVWTSPKNAIAIVQEMTDLMSEKDADHAETYRRNSVDYIAQLEQLDAAFQEVTEHAQRNTILIADRFPFRYLADAYGLEYYAAFSGCSSETEPSAATVAFLIEKTKEEQLPVVFTVDITNPKMAESIVEVTGAKHLVLQSCHNLTKDQREAGETYLSLMTQNVECLREALN